MKSVREKENQSIRRCNNYAVLHSIPCSPECKIVGKILLDHPLSYALTATAHVPAVYLQQFWKTINKTVGYQGVVDKKKNVIQYPRFIKLIIADLMEKYPSIPRRHDKDYHSIKDDTPLVSVYSTGNVLFRGMRIPDAFLTAEIHTNDNYKEYETVFVRVDVPMNQPQPVVSTQGTHRSTPRAHRIPTLTAASSQGKKRKQRAKETSSLKNPLKVTIRQKKQSTPSIPPPGDDRERDEIAESTILSLTLHKTALAAEAQENIAKVQEKLDEEEIKRMVEGEEDKESYESEFADSILNDDNDDEKDEDEVNDDDVEKMDDAAKENDNDDHTDHTLVGTQATSSMETRNEQIFLFILDTAITKAGIKLLPHRAHFSCSWDTLGISTLKASALGSFPLLEYFPTASEVYSTVSESFPLLMFQLLEEFGDSYKAPLEETGKGVTDEGSAKKMGKTVAITTKDMQKRRNDVKAKTTLLLAVPNEHHGKSKVSAVQGVSTSGVQVSTASTDVATTNLSHVTVCAYIATQPNGSQIKYEDITQIDDDDIEEMDIKWNLALLSMRADRFWKKTGKKITIQGSDVAGFDKSKVECFNCHKMGHFARECRAPRSQDKGRRESYKKDPKVEEPAPKAMIAIDGIGWDWSYMAEEDENHALVADEEEVPTEYALMAKSSSSSDNEVYDDSFCSKSCRKNTKNLNNKVIKLNEELSDCETDLYNYKRGLSQVEARLVEFKENEIKFCERIRVLERDIEIRDNKIENLRNKLEEVKKEKESIDFKIEKFDNASKDLDSLLGNQRLVIDKKGLGFNEYSDVPPPPAQVYSPPKKDLSWMGLPEFVDDTVTDYSRPIPSIDVSKDVSDDQKAIWKGNSASFSQKCTGTPHKVLDFEHLKFDCKQNTWVNKGKIWTRIDNDHDNMKYPSTLNNAYLKLTSFVKPAHSYVKRPFVRKTAIKNKVWVPTARTKFLTVVSKFPTAKPTVAAVKGNRGKAVKASACWIWKPKQNQLDQGSNLNGVSGIPQDNIDDKGYWDSGCSRHMTGNISYRSEYEPYDGGYVSFGHGGGKITGKGTSSTNI
ncbi:ribonuclease H-like domain-containing protein [Tanacetum coccineum]